jgi:hypothetical protein
MRRIHNGCIGALSAGAGSLRGKAMELTSVSPGGTREAWSLGLAEESMDWILRPQGFDAVGDVTVVNVRPINFHEVRERGLLIAGRFVG